MARHLLGYAVLPLPGLGTKGTNCRQRHSQPHRTPSGSDSPKEAPFPWGENEPAAPLGRYKVGEEAGDIYCHVTDEVTCRCVIWKGHCTSCRFFIVCVPITMAFLFQICCRLAVWPLASTVSSLNLDFVSKTRMLGNIIRRLLLILKCCGFKTYPEHSTMNSGSMSLYRPLTVSQANLTTWEQAASVSLSPFYRWDHADRKTVTL